MAKPQIGPVDHKAAPKQVPEPDLVPLDEESEVEVGDVEHEESRNILGYDE